MRTYERTHPWITFQLDLRRASHSFWMLLGEAQSKVSHVAGVPLLPDVQHHLYQLYLAKGALATTAIEGNTLSEEEALRRVEGKRDLGPSREYLGREIDNIVRACNEIAGRVLQSETANLTPEAIRRYNLLVLEGLPKDEDVHPGEIRTHSVGVGTYRGAPAEDCEHLLQRLCDWLATGFESEEGYRVAYGALKAIVAHLYLAWIHPFADGNGRTARLMEFHILLASGLPATAAHLLSNHYNQTRSEYYRLLSASSKSEGNVIDFVEYALRGFVDALREQIEVIKGQQLTVHLINHIHDQFPGKASRVNERRRHLALDLVAREGIVPTGEVRRITPRTAEAYAGKTDKMVSRDVAHLEKLGLVERTERGIRLKREIMLAYLPAKRTDPA